MSRCFFMFLLLSCLLMSGCLGRNGPGLARPDVDPVLAGDSYRCQAVVIGHGGGLAASEEHSCHATITSVAGVATSFEHNCQAGFQQVNQACNGY